MLTNDFTLLYEKVIMKWEIRQMQRLKGRTPVWTCKIRDESLVIFDDEWVSLKFLNEASAKWFADLITALHAAHVCIPRKTQRTWSGKLDDDCWLESQEGYAHAEHIDGPFGKGGIWYCHVSFHNRSVFYSADQDIQIRSGAAARWLSEIILLAVIHGVDLRTQSNKKEEM